MSMVRDDSTSGGITRHRKQSHSKESSRECAKHAQNRQDKTLLPDLLGSSASRLAGTPEHATAVHVHRKRQSSQPATTSNYASVQVKLTLQATSGLDLIR